MLCFRRAKFKQKIYFLRNVHLFRCLDQARPSWVTTASASGAETRSTMFQLGRFPLFSVLTPHLSFLRIPFWSLNSQPCREDPKGLMYYQSTKFISMLGIRTYVLQKRSKALSRNVVVSRVSCLSLGRLLCVNSTQVPYL